MTYNTYEDKFKGRVVKLKDLPVITPPITYEQFVSKDDEWPQWGSSSDLAWKAFKYEFNFVELDDINDETWGEGFEILPTTEAIEQIVRPRMLTARGAQEENPLDIYSLREIAEAYRAAVEISR